MSMITPFDIQRWQRKEQKRGLKPATINRGWHRLRAVLGRAAEWGVIPSARLSVKPLKVADRRVRFLSPDERKRLSAALEARETKRREERARMQEWQRKRGKRELPNHGAFTDRTQP